MTLTNYPQQSRAPMTHIARSHAHSLSSINSPIVTPTTRHHSPPHLLNSDAAPATCHPTLSIGTIHSFFLTAYTHLLSGYETLIQPQPTRRHTNAHAHARARFRHRRDCTHREGHSARTSHISLSLTMDDIDRYAPLSPCRSWPPPALAADRSLLTTDQRISRALTRRLLPMVQC